MQRCAMILLTVLALAILSAVIQIIPSPIRERARHRVAVTTPLERVGVDSSTS